MVSLTTVMFLGLWYIFRGQLTGAWLEVDLTEDTVVSGVITQGDPNEGDVGHVTEYKIWYRTRDSPLLKNVSDANGESQVKLTTGDANDA